jgi:hypothetical protein
MRLLSYINEKWVILPYTKKKIEILENPSKKEITKLLGVSGYGRFIADRQDVKVYIWNGYECIHQTVYNALEITGIVIFGGIRMIDGNWVMVEESGMSYYKTRSDIIKKLKRFTWANKYIDISYYIEELSDEISNLLRRNLT